MTAKKVLLICGEPPFPAVNGIRIPTANIIEQLWSMIDLEVVIVSREYSKEIQDCTKFLVEKYNVTCHFIPGFQSGFISYKLLKIVNFVFSLRPSFLVFEPNHMVHERISACAKKANPDIVIFDSERLSVYHSAIPSGVVKICSPNDSISLALQEELRHNIHNSLFKKIFTFFNFYKCKLFESNLYDKFHLCHFVSEIDEEYVKTHFPKTKTCVVPNGVDTVFFADRALKYPSYFEVLFVGGLSGGNLRYIELFIKNVWLNLIKVNPNFRLTLVSRVRPSRKVARKFEEIGIRILCDIDDLRPVYERHGIVLSPVLKRCGILNKVLEGMSMSRAVVGYSLGFSGIEGVERGVHYLSGETHLELIEIFLKIANGDFDLASIGFSARTIMESKYDWSIIGERFYDSVIQASSASGCRG